MIIAIDGPAGSGKSTVAKHAAVALGFHYLDTGAMYRAVAVRAVAKGLDLGDEAPIARIATDEPITFGYTPGEPLPTSVFISGQDVTLQIRTPQIDLAVSPVSAFPAVRTALTQQQRCFGAQFDTVMEGRDIGTVVFPQAELKVFLTATPEARAIRRVKQNAERFAGDTKSEAFAAATDEAAVLAYILRRDAYDSSREVAPLAAAADSVTIDTTDMSIDEVVERIVDLAQARRVQGAQGAQQTKGAQDAQAAQQAQERAAQRGQA